MQRTGKRRSGLVLIEIAMVSVLLVIFAILAWNLVLVTWGFIILDSAARDAGRAAANNNNAAQGLTAARQAALAHTTDGYFVTQPTVRGTGAPNSDFRWVDNPFGTTPPSGSPYVVVTTRCRVRVPAALNFFGAPMQNNQIFYNRTYVFPILKLPFTPPVVPDGDAVEPQQQVVVAPPDPQEEVPVVVPVPVVPAPVPAPVPVPAPNPAPAPQNPAPVPVPVPPAPAPVPVPVPPPPPPPPPIPPE